MLPALPALPSALLALRVASPAFALLAAFSVLLLRPPVPGSPSPVRAVVVATRIPRRAAILALLSLTALTFLLDGLVFVIYAVLDKAWPAHTGIEINAVLGLVAFGLLAALGAWKDVQGAPVWESRRVKAGVILPLLLDTALVVLLALRIKKAHYLDAATIAHLAFPAFRILLLIPLNVALATPRVTYTPLAVEDEDEEAAQNEASYLLPQGEASGASEGLATVANKDGQYGTFRSNGRRTPPSGLTTRAATPAPSHVHLTSKPATTTTKDITLDPSWSEIWSRLQRIIPYLWPSKSRPLQLLGLACFGLLAVGRFVNFLLPLTLGELIRVLGDASHSPWPYLFLYVGLRYLQSTGGISALREALWAPVMQYSDREMSQLSFDHLLNLSFAFHTHRKTGEILRILDRGAAINRIFELLTFNLLPIIADITVALVVFVIKFEWTLAIVIFFDMIAYMATSVALTRWRTHIRRQMNERDVITRGIHTDCLLNYETVKYFNGEQHEGERYRDAIRQYQALEYKVIMSLNILNLAQNLIISLGLLVGSMIVALRVVNGQSTPSDFVIFLTYIQQLYAPLTMLGSIYRSVNQGLVDTEKLLKLLNESTDVTDNPGATDLIVENGEIEFDDVSFSYDGRSTALNGVSFKVPKGSSVALVGESGSGKSTILRLLYRFYDLKEGEGRILVDGHDIRDVTQSSLRKAIGVVPQDSVLFNNSIAYNIGYGKFGSTQEEIETAAKAAQMHERIVAFPDGYDTKVGERGVRLSGGEKQRVAIARTLLKNPPVLLLDEATSALDTSTEKDIQKALQNLVKGRSSLSIAHRLSTIASADIILVLKEGQIVEHGTHAELLAKDGIFAAMWADQITASEGDGPSSRGDDGDVKEAIEGYSVDPVELESKLEQENPSNTAVFDLLGEPLADSPAGGSENLPEAESTNGHAKAASVKDTPAPEVPEEIVVAPPTAPAPAAAPIAFPVSPVQEEDTSAPIAFPSSPVEDEPAGAVDFKTAEQASTLDEALPPMAFPTEETASPPVPAEAIGTPTPAGVTFSPEIGSPSSRSGTPDPNAEPKRKRISSQNFQRLARRISISGRRQGSTSSIPILPSFMRGESSKDDASLRREESASKGDSPAPSVKDDDKDKAKKLKKEKKEKRKTLL